MANNFNDNANKKNLNGSDISYTTYRTNYSNDEMMKENNGVPSSGGGSNLENNKTTTIDVSTYSTPVEVEPSENYDGMKKVTVSCTNIPSGAITLYCWGDTEQGVYGFTPLETLSVGDKLLSVDASLFYVNEQDWYTVIQVDTNSIRVSANGSEYTLVRFTEHDISF